MRLRIPYMYQPAMDAAVGYFLNSSGNREETMKR